MTISRSIQAPTMFRPHNIITRPPNKQLLLFPATVLRYRRVPDLLGEPVLLGEAVFVGEAGLWRGALCDLTSSLRREPAEGESALRCDASISGL